MDELVSVLIATYNHAAYIERAIVSVISQTVSSIKIEIVVVDDGSTDDTYRIAQQVASGFDPNYIRVFRKENGGPSSCVNFAARRANGKVFAFFSGDDIMLHNHLATSIETIRTGGFDIVCTLPRWIDSQGDPLADCQHHGLFRVVDQTRRDKFLSELINGNFICAPTVVIKKCCWDSVSEFDETLWHFQDYDYWLRAAIAGYQFKILSEPGVSYRWHGRNLSGGDMGRSKGEDVFIVSRAIDSLKDTDLRALLFGPNFESSVIASTSADMRALLKLKHRLEPVRSIGRFELWNILSSKDGRYRNCDRLF